MPPRNRPQPAQTRRSRLANVLLSASTTRGSADLHRGHRGTPCAIGPTRFHALQVGQPMMVIITRVEPGRAAVASPPDQPNDGGSGRTPAATRRTCVKRSIETIRTSCSTRSTPRARTRHMTRQGAARAPPSPAAAKATPPGRAQGRGGDCRSVLVDEVGQRRGGGGAPFPLAPSRTRREPFSSPGSPATVP